MPRAMAYEQILTDTDDGVLTITLNRPERLNAWTGQMGQELREAFDAADADDEVRAIIVTGAGRGFCAGADLEGGGETFDYRKRDTAGAAGRDNGGEFTLRVFESTKPVIAAINGPAVGDRRDDDPADGHPPGRRRRPSRLRLRAARDHPRGRSSWFLPRVVGISQAMEWVATGRVFDAQEGLERGLLRSLHPKASCSAPRALWRARSQTTRRRSRSRSRGS